MSDARFIVTGGRKRESNDDYELIKHLLYIDDMDVTATVIQGGCPDGIDLLARKVADYYGYDIETVLADFDQHPNDAVEISNQEMADRGADVCFAFPNPGAPSLGTWDMVHRAIDAGIDAHVYVEKDHSDEWWWGKGI